MVCLAKMVNLADQEKTHLVISEINASNALRESLDLLGHLDPQEAQDLTACLVHQDTSVDQDSQDLQVHQDPMECQVRI